MVVRRKKPPVISMILFTVNFMLFRTALLMSSTSIMNITSEVIKPYNSPYCINPDGDMEALFSLFQKT